MNKAVFIDRDGVINIEVKHPEIKDKEGRSCTDPLSPDELVFFDGVKEAFSLLRQAGIKTCIISNQAGYAKGFVDDTTLKAIKTKLKDELNPDGIYYCTHHEDYTGICDCKKPKKGLLLQAAKEHHIDIPNSYMVGDRRNDMVCGSDCKRCFMVATREGEDPEANKAMLNPELQKKVTIVSSLLEAAKIIKIRCESHTPT